MISYEQWCTKNTNIIPLARSLKSSVPEQYIGFYLQIFFGAIIEYQKQFDWLGNNSLDIFISSLQLGIEYDGIYFHANREEADKLKTSLCKKNGITIFRICETEHAQSVLTKRNVVYYSPSKNYSNIGEAIKGLCSLINKSYNLSIDINVDITRDINDIISYVQNKYHKKSIAYVWPETKDYWDYTKNKHSIYDVFYTDKRKFALKCPHCGENFILHTDKFYNRRSLIPCECEYSSIEQDLSRKIDDYIKHGTILSFDYSLQSRRLYDRIQSKIRFNVPPMSKEEIELYKKSNIFPDITTR